MSNYKPFAFVLMPFNKEFSDVYKFGIKKTAEELDIIAERVDEQHFSETMLERIYRQIENCDFIIADMTGRNPNVFYEVGYAHAKEKLCALITQDATDIPFDLKHHSHVIYDGTIEDLKNKLLPKMKWLKNEINTKRSKTIIATVKTDDGFLQNRDYYDEGTFNLTLKLKNGSDKRSPEIEQIYVKTSDSWSLSISNTECPHEISEKLKLHLITPKIRRLSPNSFWEEKIEFKRDLWSKFSGKEQQEKYVSKGTIQIEIVTSEGTISYDYSIEVEFDDIPF